MRGKKGPLVVLEYPGGKGGGMNAKRYKEQVLEAVLRGFYAEMEAERHGVTFQQDGAASHRAKLTKQWFAEEKIPLLFHPANSPDVSPIQPCWHELKKGLRSLEHPPTTLATLSAAVHAVWNALPIEDVDKYVNRMGDIVEAVLKAKGGHTKF